MELLPDLTKPAAEGAVEAIELPPDATSLDLLQAVYRDAGQPLATRIRCAVAALPFERPKLAVVANIDGFAAQMKEIARKQRPGGNVIDAQPIPKTPAITAQEEQ